MFHQCIYKFLLHETLTHILYYKNLLYVNYCDIDDEEFGISDEDKAYYGGVEAYIEEYFSDETRYPDATDPNLGVMQTFKDNDAMISMWERVKAHGIFSWKLVVFFAIMVAAVFATWGVSVLVRELRGRKRLLVKR